jgi:polyhydroxybutyrate depolymerase
VKKQLCLLAFLLMPAGFFALGAATNDLQQMTFTVGGVVRTALVYVAPGAKTVSSPLVFVFHGHGGNSRQVARAFGIHRQWPEAISVYMQGLNTPGQLTDPEGTRPGWQSAIGHQGDRDLKFFDAVLGRLKQDYRVDPKRVYCTGHSNGGGFTYLLWLARGDVFAAVAPSSAAVPYAAKLTPKPALILGGQNDPLVKFAWQQRSMDAVRKINGAASVNGQPWDKQCTIYQASNSPPLVTCIFPGGHQFNSDAPALIVKFFKEHPGETE